MTCVELYHKVSEGMQSHYLKVQEGIGCSGCPYYIRGAYDHIIEENDRPCYKKLKDDEEDLMWILKLMDTMHGWVKKKEVSS